MASSAAAAKGATSLTSRLHESIQPFLQHLEKLYLQLPESAQEYLASASQAYSTFGLGIASAIFVVVAVSMSRRWGSWTDRLSPFGSRGEPKVTEADYSYITSADLEEPTPVYNPSHRPPPTMSTPAEDDVLLIKHGKITYPIKFPAYSIGDGRLEVRDVKKRAAETMGVSKAHRLRLVYKGQQLKDDNSPCRDYGLKNRSELLCLISDGPSGSDSEDASDDGSIAESSGGKKKRVRKSKKKGKKSSKESILTPPEEASPKARSPAPSPGPPKPQTPMEKLQALKSHFHTKILPLCVRYTADPPADQKKKDFEYKKLSETIMNEVLLKLDAVEVEGNPEARQLRKDLVKETQEVLNGLDARAAA